jgi:hypothetical protein
MWWKIRSRGARADPGLIEHQLRRRVEPPFECRPPAVPGLGRFLPLLPRRLLVGDGIEHRSSHRSRPSSSRLWAPAHVRVPPPIPSTVLRERGLRRRAGMSLEFAARQRSPNVREADLEQAGATGRRRRYCAGGNPRRSADPARCPCGRGSQPPRHAPRRQVALRRPPRGRDGEDSRRRDYRPSVWRSSSCG